MTITKEIPVGIAGYFKIEVRNSEGKVVKELPWQKNEILDSGLRSLHDSAESAGLGLGKYCVVGTSADAVDVALDTGVKAQLGSRVVMTTYTSNRTGEYFAKTSEYNWAIGDTTGNIAEVGITNSTSTRFLTRARIKDALGVPTTITVLADEQLRVYYELRLYWPMSDLVEIINVNVGTVAAPVWVATTMTTRPLYIGSATGWDIYQGSGDALFAHEAVSNYTGWYSYGSDMALALASATIPSGTFIGQARYDATFVTLYDPAHTTFEMTVPSTKWNVAGGIGGMKWSARGDLYRTCWQTKIDPPLPKTNLDVATVNFRISVTRQ